MKIKAYALKNIEEKMYLDSNTFRTHMDTFRIIYSGIIKVHIESLGFKTKFKIEIFSIISVLRLSEISVILFFSLILVLI